MSTSMEDVLLQVSQVRYKKGDGTLFLMDQRLIWMVENKDTVVVSHPYADIKCMKPLNSICYCYNKNCCF